MSVGRLMRLIGLFKIINQGLTKDLVSHTHTVVVIALRELEMDGKWVQITLIKRTKTSSH